MQLPWKTAPKAVLGSPATIVVSVLSGLLLSFVAAATVVHHDAVGSATVHYETGQTCPQSIAPEVLALKLPLAGAAELVDQAKAMGRQHGFPDAVVAEYGQPLSVDFGGSEPALRLGYRDDEHRHLTASRGGDPTGLWVPQALFDAGKMRLGQRAEALPPVTAVTPDFSSLLPDWWCTERSYVLPSLLAPYPPPPVAWLPDPAAFQQFDRKAVVDVDVHFLVTPPSTVRELRDVSTRGDALAAELRARLAGNDASAAQVMIVQPFATPGALVGQAQAKVLHAVLPLTIVSLLVGLLGVAALAVQWCDRRHTELYLLWARGTHPVDLGGMAVLEVAAPITLGGLAGVVVARAAASWYAPSTALDSSAVAGALLAALAVLVVAIGVTGATVAIRAALRYQAPRRGRGRFGRWARWLPWEVATAAVAFPSWQRLSSGVRTLSAPSPLPTVDPLALAFPLLVVATVAGVVVRLSRWALAASRTVNLWSHPAAQLALRRLAAGVDVSAGVLLLGAIAVGTVAVGTGIADTQDGSLNTKSGMFAGAETVAEVPTEVARGHRPLPASIAATSTLVGFADPGGVSVLVIDPDTFRRGAWPGAPGVDEVLRELRGHPGDGTSPAVRVGAAPDGTLSVDGVVPLRTVGSIEAFPGIRTGGGYVISQAEVHEPRLIDSWSVWSASPPQRLAAALDSAGITPISNISTRAELFDALPFLTVRWTFSFVGALGVLLGVVAAASLLLAVEVRRRQNTLSSALAMRMGMRTGTLALSHVLEFGVLAALATLTGVITGVLETAIAVRWLDPAPWLRPRVQQASAVPFVVIAVLAAAAMVGVAVVVGLRSVRSAKLANLVRE